MPAPTVWLVKTVDDNERARMPVVFVCVERDRDTGCQIAECDIIQSERMASQSSGLLGRSCT